MPELANVYAIVVLAALVLEWGLGVVADLLNLRALSTEIPRDLEGIFDAETYRRSQEYTRARIRFGLFPATVDLVAVLAFWLAGGFSVLQGWVEGLELAPVPTGLVFVGVLVALRTLLHLPFRAWATFVIEERFGFNRTTPATFAADTAKGLLLGAVLGGILLAGVLAFFHAAGELAWLWAWIAVSLFLVVVQFVAPAWIFPLFNRFQPLEEGELRSSILAYARRVGFPLRDLYVVDGSRRSSKANAFFTGFGRNKRVALFDTLVEKHTVGELVAVVAHEIGHFKRHHVLTGMVLSIVHTGVLFALLSVFLGEPELYAAFGVEGTPIHAGLVFFGLLYTPVEALFAFGLNALSRKHEYEADRWAAETTGDPVAMETALKRLSADNLANLTPHPLYVALNHTHPPLRERIAALRSSA